MPLGKTNRWIIAVTVLMVFLCGLGLSLLLERERMAASRNDALAAATRMTRQIEQHLANNLAVTYALAALVRQGGGEVRDFDAIAAEFLTLYPGVTALQLAPGGTIRRIVPLAGNEKAIGHDLLTDEKRNKEARLAMASGRLTLAGPFELIQGGEAVIGRLPVFTGAHGDKFWGFTIALIRMKAFLQTTQIEEIEQQGFSYELWRVHPDSGARHVFARSRTVLADEPVMASLDVPNGRWLLSVTPAGGWLPHRWLMLQLLLAAAVAAAVGWGMSRNLRAQQALIASERRYRALVEASAQIVWSCDAQGRVIEDSPSWRAYTGQSFAQWRDFGYVDCIHADDRAAVMAHWQAGLASGAAVSNEYRLRHHSGEWRWNLARGVPIRDEAGKVLSWVGMNIDIHDKRLAEDSLRQAMFAADAANRAKSTFIATMSHEIRTPMNGILGMAQLLMMPDLSEAERKDFAKVILDSGQTLQALLNDILDLSKIEAGKVEFEHAAFSPGALVNETAALFADAARRKQLVIETARGEALDELHYWGDPHRLRQMLANLVSNAVKFTASGVVRIEAGLARGGRMLEFAVKDTGSGVAAERLALLFQPFCQADASTTRKHGGTGLGLSIVRNLARLMGGDAGAESTPGVGSRFWFCIPADVVLQDGDDSPVERTAGDLLASASGKLAGRILVAEDNPVNCQVVATLLHRLGLTCEHAENGRSVVAAATREPRPDLVLMECQLPEIDGLEATRQIRCWEAENHQPHLPIIALTAGVYAEDRHNCACAGMDGFLAKPLNLGDLSGVLEHWLTHANNG